jgi:hypothetical protein
LLTEYVSDNCSVILSVSPKRERLTLNARDQQRIEVVTRWIGGALNIAEATSLLGCSERHAWRLRQRMAGRGVDGLVHGNRGHEN